VPAEPREWPRKADKLRWSAAEPREWPHKAKKPRWSAAPCGKVTMLLVLETKFH